MPNRVLLREERVHRGEADADLAERLAHRAPRVLDEHDEERQRQERHQRQRGVDPQHDDHDAERADDVGGERDRALREHLVEALDVVRHARHQAADGDAVEERRALREDVVEDRDPEVVHRALARPLDHVRLDERERVLGDDDADVERGVERQHADLARADVVVERVLEQVRQRQLEPDLDQRAHDPAGEQPGVRRDVVGEPADQLEVVGLAEDLLGLGRARVHGTHEAASFSICISVSSWVRYRSV